MRDAVVAHPISPVQGLSLFCLVGFFPENPMCSVVSTAGLLGDVLQVGPSLPAAFLALLGGRGTSDIPGADLPCRKAVVITDSEVSLHLLQG